MKKVNEFQLAFLVLMYIFNFGSILGLVAGIIIKVSKETIFLGIFSFILSLLGIFVMTIICSNKNKEKMR